MNLDKKHKQIAVRLRLARQNAGLSQGQAAKQLGLARPAITECEAARRKVSAAELAAMAELYGVAPTWLLGEADQSNDANQDRIELAAREIAGLRSEDLASVMQLVRSIRTRPRR